MKLTIKEFAPYLPHRLKGTYYCVKYKVPKKPVGKDIFILTGYMCDKDIDMFKPFLKPLEDLDEEIEAMKIDFGSTEHNKLKYLVLSKDTQSYQNLKYSTILYLAKNHYDFQFLIEKDLAYDINTLKE